MTEEGFNGLRGLLILIAAIWMTYVSQRDTENGHPIWGFMGSLVGILLLVLGVWVSLGGV